jgi:hypothetical protein
MPDATYCAAEVSDEGRVSSASVNSSSRGLKSSWLGGRPRLTDDLCRAEARHKIDENHFAAFTYDELVAHHLFAPIVAPFDQQLGSQSARSKWVE